jgi:DNA recombination protein RmuC
MNVTTLVWSLAASIVSALSVTALYNRRLMGLRERNRILELDITEADHTIDEQREIAAARQRELQCAREEVVRLTERLAQQEVRFQEQLAVYRESEAQAGSAFKVLASDVLKSNSEQFSRQFNETARALLEQLGGSSRMQVEAGNNLLQSIGSTIAEKITEVERSVKELEKLRIATDAQVKKQLEVVSAQSERVGVEAARLHGALTNARIQGEWGQIQLRNLVERAGMLEYCDFVEQVSVEGEHGRVRPDLIVRLPNSMQVIIDAKAPTKGYAEALREGDAKERSLRLREISDAIKRHIPDMASKNYPAQFAPALEYTVVFLPNESVLFSALTSEPELLSYAEERKVILTTPLSLLAFLRTVALGWTQVRLHDNAREIQQLGRELHKRLNRFVSNFARVGKGLDTAVRSFNDAVGSSRMVNSTLRRFEELGVGDGSDIQSVEEVTEETRVIETSEDLDSHIDSDVRGPIEHDR